MTTKKWTIRFVDEEGSSHYVNVMGKDVRKVIDYVLKENGIDVSALEYLSAEEVFIID